MEKTRLLLLIPFLLLLFSCEEDQINMLTKINPDGSCTREFIQITSPEFITGDTAEHNPFPFTIDSLWDVDIIWNTNSAKVVHKWPFPDLAKDTTRKKDNLQARAKRHFTRVENLNNYNFFELTEWKSFHPEVSYEKKFKWFYSYYAYKEHYLKFIPFNHIPITEFMTEDEIKLWFQGEDKSFSGMNGIKIHEYLSEVEKGYNNWIDRNVFEEQYLLLLDYVHLLNDKNLTREFLMAKKDSIYELTKHEYLEGELLDYMDDIFNTNLFQKTLSENDEFVEQGEKFLEFLDLYALPVNYKLIMPGKVYETNSSIQKGDTLIWKLDAYRFTINDYEIYAESRKPNIWAFIVSAIFILGVGWSYFRK